MNIEFLIFFIAVNVANVIIQTIKSLCTIKGGKLMAALANAIAFGFYQVVLVYAVTDDLSLFLKAIIVGLCNLVGVYIVKFCEEKNRKDKLWKVEATIPTQYAQALIQDCQKRNLSYNYTDIEKYFLFNFYCETREDSLNVKHLLKEYDAKYFVTEARTLAL